MNIRMTNHFIIRMQERGIAIDDVRKCLNSPDSVTDAGAGKLEAGKALDSGKTITVIYFKQAHSMSHIVLVTAYYSL